jgi:single-strand DNA-binding protein
MNIVILSGYIGQDAKQTSLQNCNVSEFSLATTAFFKNEKKTTWHNIKVFNHENLIPYLRKGVHISVKGHLDTNTWEKDGQKFSKTFVIADTIELSPDSKNVSFDGPY